jgi:hypothetical protein
VYQQKVYGLEEVRLYVGYEYQDCTTATNGGANVSGGGGPIWQTMTALLAGFQPTISDIGGWGVNIHHRLAQGETDRQADRQIRHIRQTDQTHQILGSHPAQFDSAISCTLVKENIGVLNQNSHHPLFHIFLHV